jgi:hypothetical protein
MTAWAFIDYENVSTLEDLKLDTYERLFMFCGPSSKKLKIDTLPGKGFCRVEFLRISTTGKNNLDFHLAFHLGRLHGEAGPGIAFHIISKDRGYDGLIQHLKDLKRTCRRIEPEPKPVVLSEAAQRIVHLLENAKNSRPRREKTLLPWLESHRRKDDPDAKALFEELKKARQLQCPDGTVTYTLQG